MRNITGRIAAVIAGLALAAVIILIFMNGGGGDEPEPSPSPPIIIHTPTPSPAPSENGGDATPPPSPSPTPTAPAGQRHEYSAPGGAALSLTVPDGFSRMDTDGGAVFEYGFMVFIEIVLLPGSAAENADSFRENNLSPYLLSGEWYTSPEIRQIGSVSDAVFLSIGDDDSTVEAWLIDAGEYFFAVIAGHEIEYNAHDEIFEGIFASVELSS